MASSPLISASWRSTVSVSTASWAAASSLSIARRRTSAFVESSSSSDSSASRGAAAATNDSTEGGGRQQGPSHSSALKACSTYDAPQCRSRQFRQKARSQPSQTKSSPPSSHQAQASSSSSSSSAWSSSSAHTPQHATSILPSRRGCGRQGRQGGKVSAQTVHRTSFWSASTSMASLRGHSAAAAGAASVTAAGAVSLGGASVSIACSASLSIRALARAAVSGSPLLGRIVPALRFRGALRPETSSRPSWRCRALIEPVLRAVGPPVRRTAALKSTRLFGFLVSLQDASSSFFGLAQRVCKELSAIGSGTEAFSAAPLCVAASLLHPRLRAQPQPSPCSRPLQPWQRRAQ